MLLEGPEIYRRIRRARYDGEAQRSGIRGKKEWPDFAPWQRHGG